MNLSKRSEFLPETTLFFRKFCFSLRTSKIKNWFNVPTTQMSIFILFESIGVLFRDAFSLWVSLSAVNYENCSILPSNKKKLNPLVTLTGISIHLFIMIISAKSPTPAEELGGIS